MKTTHDFSKASEARPTWWCRLVWWLEALALLVIMIIISACRALQEHRKETVDDGHDFDGLSSPAR